MKLGVYRRPKIDEDSDVYVRLALYDFDADEWHETSDGNIVSKASENPSPEEVKVRFDIDPGARRTVVATPEAMETADVETRVADSDMPVEEGHEAREERGGPLDTQIEREAQKAAGYRVFPDDFEITEEKREFYEERGETPIHESEWEFSFADEFDFDFTPISEATDE